MTPKLSEEQRKAVEAHGGRPIEVVDPNSNASYYLVSSEQFSRLRALLDPDDFDIKESYPAQQQALSKIWDDPALDVYNELDNPRTTPGNYGGAM